MSENQQTQPDIICGVERNILEDFLNLIKIAYPLVDEANFFLESESDVSGINIAVTNQRDVLSHLCTMVSDSSLSYENRLEQLSTAEEHLRRAVIEPYFKATSILIGRIRELYTKYKENVLPLKDSEVTLSSAPSSAQIEKRLATVNTARNKARAAKRRNKLDEGWTEGVKLLIETFQALKELRGELEEHLLRVKQLEAIADQKRVNAELARDSKTHLKLGWTHLIFVVVTFILTLLFEHFILAPSLHHAATSQTQQIDQQNSKTPSK